MPIPRPAKQPSVYILASKRDGVLYIGVTSDLAQRVGLHKQDLIEGFTKKYGVHTLVYYEMRQTMPEAIRREKQLKKWNRAWKVRLIEQLNPEWRDLWEESGEILMGGPGGREVPDESLERLQ
jgi:putative endonuclease